MWFEVESWAMVACLVDDHDVDRMLSGRVPPGLPPAYRRVSAALGGLSRTATSAELAGEGVTVERLAGVIRESRGLGHPN